MDANFREEPDLHKPFEMPRDTYFPEDDEELNIKATEVTRDQKAEIYGRYLTAISLLENVTRPSDVVGDVYCGSGFGIPLLAARFRYAFGIEPNDFSRRYATKHFKKVKFTDSVEGLDVALFMDTVHKLTATELRMVAEDARAVLLVVPILPGPTEYHRTPFASEGDVISYARKAGLKPRISLVEHDTDLYTGEHGNLYYGLFVKPDFKPDHLEEKEEELE